MTRIAANGTELFHRLDGPEEAPVLLLSNSLGTTHEMWEPQIAALTPRFRVLRYDSRGHGRSAVPEGPYTLEMLGRDALALTEALGIERFAFCGLSKGGMVGQWLGLHAPDRLTRLVLCNTAASVGQPEMWNKRIETVRQHGMAAIVDAVIDRWFTKPFQAADPEAVAKVRRQILSIAPAGYAACSAAVRDVAFLEELHRIRTPTLVVNGLADVALPPALGEAIAARIPDCGLVAFDAAHLSNIEAREAFNGALLDFLKE